MEEFVTNTVISWVFAAMMVGGLCGCEKKLSSAAEVKKLNAMAKKMDKKYQADITRWRARLLALSGGVLPGSGVPCEPQNLGNDKNVLRPADHKKLSTYTPNIYKHKLRRTNKYSKISRSKLGAGAVPYLLKTLQKPFSSTSFQTTLVILKERRPKMQAGGKYLPGFIQGRLLVWDANGARFVCGADVHVQTGKKMRVYGSDGSTQKRLEKSLEREAFIKGTKKLRDLR
jgi:hypothetical protein